MSPVLLVISGIIKIRMQGPVFFVQKRAGRYGKEFNIVKFRTMDTRHDGSSISVKGETRITPLGEVLRRYKLDELPELWNVLKGEMSLVGPRPDMLHYVSLLKGDERLILELRPGITGPASLKYFNEEEILSEVEDPKKFNDEVIWPDKVRINLEYYYQRSLLGDVKLVLKTVLKKY